MMEDHLQKSSDYYEITRTDVTHLVPDFAERIIEIGCGAGNTLKYLKDNSRGKWFGGVEINPAVAEIAADRLDQVWAGPIEEVLSSEGGLNAEPKFDVILCLDVLEHLIDPWTVTRQLSELLNPGGVIISSIPNVRYYKVSLNLLTKGHWRYEDSGVLDSTHLRFFTKETATEMITGAGLEISSIEPTAPMKPWRNKWILNKLSGGRLIDIYAYNYLISARKPN